MTQSDWLDRRTPPPPDELAAAIRTALKQSGASDDPAPTELLESARALLEKVLASECAQREAALELLTADALVTYALEMATEQVGGLGDLPERAMAVLAGVSP